MKSLQYLVLSILTISVFSCSLPTESTLDDGLIIKESPHNFDTTYDKLRSILENNPNLKILMELDHSKNAASVDLKLKPTCIILFGNPKMGTPLMLDNPTVSIDLPQKIIVYLDKDSKVKVAYNDPLYLKSRHGLTETIEVLGKISGALNMITDKVVSE